jgi:hypothetical protein
MCIILRMKKNTKLILSTRFESLLNFAFKTDAVLQESTKSDTNNRMLVSKT